ncbi:hypothetical protein M2335_003261 [Sphingobium sp. B12D2B]|nr:hypothetical protein [Sphingobium sp. B12D2B]
MFRAQFEGKRIEPFTCDNHVQTLDRLAEAINATPGEVFGRRPISSG